VVVKGADAGAILKGYSYRKAEGDFLLAPEDSGAAVQNRVARLDKTMLPLGTLACGKDDSAFNSEYEDYVFLYGTGYAAKVVEGKFVLANIPKDKYKAYHLYVPRDNPLSDEDTANVYELRDSLDTDSRFFTYGALHDVVPVKDYFSLP
jgi:hypothetical protein